MRTQRRRTDGSWLRLPAIVGAGPVTYSNLRAAADATGAPVLYDFLRGERFDPEVLGQPRRGPHLVQSRSPAARSRSTTPTPAPTCSTRPSDRAASTCSPHRRTRARGRPPSTTGTSRQGRCTTRRARCWVPSGARCRSPRSPGSGRRAPASEAGRPTSSPTPRRGPRSWCSPRGSRPPTTATGGPDGTAPPGGPRRWPSPAARSTAESPTTRASSRWIPPTRTGSSSPRTRHRSPEHRWCPPRTASATGSCGAASDPPVARGGGRRSPPTPPSTTCVR